MSSSDPTSGPSSELAAPSEAEVLREEVESIRRSKVLGRPGLLSRLFDFLYQCALAGRSPKEIEVALEALGKDASFDVTQDSLVRVYVHKLRRKLDEYYARSGGDGLARVTIPKGEYRLAVEYARPRGSDSPPPRSTRGRHSALRWLVVALLISLVGNAMLASMVFFPAGHPEPLQEVRSNPFWSRLLQDERPIVIAVGDYYIFGETDPSREVRRLVREFSINSRHDLLLYLEQHPEKMDTYENLDLTYLPSSVALALKDIAPVLVSGKRRVSITLVSELNPDVFKSAHVVYVGYLSGLGMLQDIVFAGSTLSVGESYDELVDHKSGAHYFSGVHLRPRENKYHDFGYVSTFPGPTGSQIVVIAGMRDAGLMHTAETLTSPAGLRQLRHEPGAGTNGFEALYEVFGLNRTNMNAKLVLAKSLDVAHIWRDASLTGELK